MRLVLNMGVIKIAILFSLLASAVYSYSWNSLSVQPNMGTLVQVDIGSSSICALSAVGAIKCTPRTTTSWTSYPLPNSLVVVHMDVGTNNDLCVVDQNGTPWGLKSGMTTYQNITIPTGDPLVRMACYAYSNNAMLGIGQSGSVYIYGSGGPTLLINGATNPMADGCIAADGSIQLLDSNGARYTYSGGSLTEHETENYYFQINCGTSSSDVVATSAVYPFLDYEMVSGGMSQFSSGMDWLAIDAGTIVGTDGNNVKLWS
jgi:hypothetical protein